MVSFVLFFTVIHNCGFGNAVFGLLAKYEQLIFPCDVAGTGS